MKNKNIQAVLVIIIFLVLIAVVGILIALNIKQFNDIDKSLNSNLNINQDKNINNIEEISKPNNNITLDEKENGTEGTQNETNIGNNNISIDIPKEDNTGNINKFSDSKNESNTVKDNQDKDKDAQKGSSTTKENVEKVTGEIQKINNLLIQQIERDYNNKNLRGVEVMSAVRQYISSTQVTIILMKSDNKSILATAGAKKVSGNVVSFKNNMFEITKENLLLEGGTRHHNSVADFNNRNSEAYIDYSKTYKSYLLRLTETQDLVGIVFVENN